MACPQYHHLVVTFDVGQNSAPPASTGRKMPVVRMTRFEMPVRLLFLTCPASVQGDEVLARDIGPIAEIDDRRFHFHAHRLEVDRRPRRTEAIAHKDKQSVGGVFRQLFRLMTLGMKIRLILVSEIQHVSVSKFDREARLNNNILHSLLTVRLFVASEITTENPSSVRNAFQNGRSSTVLRMRGMPMGSPSLYAYMCRADNRPHLDEVGDAFLLNFPYYVIFRTCSHNRESHPRTLPS
jgi:hypothetical protein